jgi:predicted DCC family thiol-disulfide oxidoreductase YuxK
MMATSVDRWAPYSYRSDPSVPSFPDGRPIIIFDGYCALCSGWARFVLRHDRREKYRLLPAQTPLGRALYVHYGLDPDSYETNILIEDGRAWFKSAGSIRMAEGLGGPWSAAMLLRPLPSGLLDRAYDLIARNRIRLFGARQVCYLAEPGQEGRFLA